MTKQDPQELYDFIQNQTGPGKTLWTKHNQIRPYKTKQDNEVIQHYNPLKDVS